MTGWWDGLYWLCYETEASCRSPRTTGSLSPGLLSPRNVGPFKWLSWHLLNYLSWIEKNAAETMWLSLPKSLHCTCLLFPSHTGGIWEVAGEPNQTGICWIYASFFPLEGHKSWPLTYWAARFLQWLEELKVVQPFPPLLCMVKMGHWVIAVFFSGEQPQRQAGTWSNRQSNPTRLFRKRCWRITY